LFLTAWPLSEPALAAELSAALEKGGSGGGVIAVAMGEIASGGLRVNSVQCEDKSKTPNRAALRLLVLQFFP
jgi:hypothetical protein